jgi:O-antigen/teichoic acid export membrane protein
VAVKTSKTDVIWNYAGTLFGMGSSFLLLPVLMFFLQPEFLSLWYIFLSLATLVNLLNAGLGPSLSRNVMYAWGGARRLYSQGVSDSHGDKPNYPLLFLVFDASRLFHLLIACVALALMATAGSLYVVYIARDIDASLYLPAWIVFCLAIFLNLYYDYFSVFLRGIGRITEYNKYLIASKVVDIGIASIMLCLGFGLLSVAVSYFVSGLVIRILSKRKLDRITSGGKPSTRNSFGDIKKVFFVLWPNCWRDWLVAVADAITTSATTVVCSLFLSLSDAGIYALCLQFATAIAKASDSILFAYQPQIANDYVCQRYKGCFNALAFCMVVYALLFLVGSLVTVCVLIPILQLIGTGYQFDLFTMLLLLLYQFLLNRYKLYAAIIAITNDLSYWLSFIVSGVVGLALSVIFLYVAGSSTAALILPQLAIQCCYNVWKWPMVARKKLVPEASLIMEVRTGIGGLVSMLQRKSNAAS